MRRFIPFMVLSLLMTSGCVLKKKLKEAGRSEDFPHLAESPRTCPIQVTAQRSSGILCVNGRPLGEVMKAPAVLHGLGDIDQASVRRDLTSGDFHGVGATLEFLIQPLNRIGQSALRSIATLPAPSSGAGGKRGSAPRTRRARHVTVPAWHATSDRPGRPELLG